jgi:cold shock CspA family protein
MLYGEIVSIKASLYAFIKVNDPISEEFGHRFFMHRDGVSGESLVSFDDCRLHDSVAFDVVEEGRGPKAVAAMITSREPGERYFGTIKNFNDKGFSFAAIEIDGETKDCFLHFSECQFNLAADSVGMRISCELETGEKSRPACIFAREAQ